MRVTHDKCENLLVNAAEFACMLKNSIYHLPLLPQAVTNPIRDGPFRGCSPMGGRSGKVSLPTICHTYPTR